MFHVLTKSIATASNCAQHIKINAVRAMSSLVNRKYLFNYFEKPAITDELFASVWTTGGKHVQKQENFVSTYLHKSMDPNAKHPYVNFALTNGYDICMFASPDKFWMGYMKEIMSHNLKASPAPYDEIESYNGNKLTVEDKDIPEDCGIFITSVKVNDTIKEAEVSKQWKTLTGANLLHEKLGDLSIDSHLYKVAPFENMRVPVKFQFTVRTVVKDIQDSVGHSISKEINKRNTLNGIETDTAFYRIVTVMKKV